MFSTPTFAAITFSISNPQYQEEEISVDVSLSGLTSSSCSGSCYLQGALTSTTVNKYFGFTKNNSGGWYEYVGSPDTSYIQSTFFSFPFQATWSGKLTLKSNSNDPDYNGPGNYNLKVWRYTGKSTSYAGVSNSLLVNVTGPATPSPTATPTQTTPPPNSTQFPVPSANDQITPVEEETFVPNPTIVSINLFEKASTSSKSVLPASTKSAFSSPKSKKEEFLSQREINPSKILIILGILVILGSAGILAKSFIK